MDLGVEPLLTQETVSPNLKRKTITLIVSCVVVSAVIVIVVIIAAVLLRNKPSNNNNNVNPNLQLKGVDSKLKGVIPVFPFTIGDRDRLIVKIQNPQLSLSSYFIYKYPTGTYNNLTDLVAALNLQSNFEAIYFSSSDTSWWINDFLGWGILNGNLTFTWTDTVYNQIQFLASPPFNDPLFAVSNTSGINDSTVQPNWTHLITAFNITPNVNYYYSQNVVLNFP